MTPMKGSMLRLMMMVLSLLLATAVGFGQRYKSYTGLVMAGYQGWFAAEGDSSHRGWYHYKGRAGFFPGSTNVDLWPDVREYARLYVSPFRFSDGTPAELYSAYDASSVDLHFKWMKEYGIDGVHMQRFVGEIRNPAGKRHFNQVLGTALKAAKKYGRAISVMYDLSGCASSDVGYVLEDWKELVSLFRLGDTVANPTYLFQNGKPLLSIWGVGFNDGRRYTIGNVGRLVDSLKVGDRVSVMLGVPYYWRTLGRDTEKDRSLLDLVRKCDLVMPWAVGRFNSRTYDVRNVAEDVAWCMREQVGYVPLVFPGFSWGNMHHDSSLYHLVPRLKGDFLWQQIAGAKEAGAQALYVAMFDEIDEGTAIYKVANEKDLPMNGHFRFVGIEDGLPTDYYLWLVGQGANWFHGEPGYGRKKPVR